MNHKFRLWHDITEKTYEIFVNLNDDPEAFFIFNHKFKTKQKAERMRLKMINAEHINTKYWTYGL